MIKTLLRSLGLLGVLCLLMLVSERLALADGRTSAFGQSQASEAAFIGVLYDLKQTQDHKPTKVTPDDYSNILDEFLSEGWNEAVLNRYYRFSRPLYTTQIFIPNMNADYGPKAFGAEKYVQPSRWVIHYKGEVSPPETGNYRFWAIADDIIAVAVNGKTVVIGNRDSCRLPKTNWKPSEGDGGYAGDGNLHAGDWMALSKDQIYDMDIIIGERPGGMFNAFLMVEKQGNTYQRDDHGHLILPVFQIAAFDTPVRDAHIAKGYPIWKSYQ